MAFIILRIRCFCSTKFAVLQNMAYWPKGDSLLVATEPTLLLDGLAVRSHLLYEEGPLCCHYRIMSSFWRLDVSLFSASSQVWCAVHHFLMVILLRVKMLRVCVCSRDGKLLIGETMRNWPWIRDIASLLDRINIFCTLLLVTILCSGTQVNTHTHRSISRQRSITIICFCLLPVMRARLLEGMCVHVCMCL